MTNSTFSCCRGLVQQRRPAASILTQTREVLAVACKPVSLERSQSWVFFLLPVSALGKKIQGTLLKRPSWEAAAVSCLLTPHPRQLPVLCSYSTPQLQQLPRQTFKLFLSDHTFSRCLGYWQRPNLITGELYMFLLLVEWPATTELPFYLIYNLRHDLNVQSIFFHKPSS